MGARWTVALALVLIAAAFLPLRGGAYVQDDHVAVETNPIVARGDLGEIFSTSYWEGARGRDDSLYRPLTILSFALERAGADASRPGRSRLVNVLLHAGATLAFLFLLRAIGAGRWSAAAATLLFAVHPVHVEAVASAVGRAETLAAGFGMVALALVARADPWNAVGPARRDAWLAAAALGAALLSKESAAACIPLLAVLALWKRPPAELPPREAWLRRAGLLLPAALAALAVYALRVRALEAWFLAQPIHPVDNMLVELAGSERAAAAFALLGHYVRLLLLPLPLTIDASGASLDLPRSWLAAAPIGGLLVALAALATMAGGFVRGPRNRPDAGSAGWTPVRRLAFGVMLFAAPYLIVGNLLFDVGALYAERFLYFPSAGFCALAGGLLGAMGAGRVPHDVRGPRSTLRWMLAILGVLLSAFTLMSWQRAGEWKDDATVFRAALAVHPDSPRASFVLGKLAAERGDDDEALRLLSRTLELRPDFFSAAIEAGAIHGRRGDYAEAARLFAAAARANPQSFRAHQNLGIARAALGRFDAAEKALRTALAWEPESATAWAALGNLAMRTGRYALAAEAYRRAIALGRDDLHPRLTLAERSAGAP